MLACQHDNMKRGHLMDNGVRFGTFQSNSHQTSLSSLCPSVKCCWVASSPTALLAEGSRTAGAQPVCPLQVGPRERERAHVSPFSGLIKVFSCSSPYFFLSPPFSLVLTPHRSHPSSFDLQYLHHPPVPIVAMGNLRNAPPPPRCPRCIEHPAKCEPISGGGWSAKPQSTSCRWQPSLRWL